MKIRGEIMQDSLNQHYLLRKLHSLTGLLPAGVFLLFHIWENSLSRRVHDPEFAEPGVANYYNEHVVHFINSINYIRFLEVALLGSLLYHAVYGCVIWWQGKSNVGRYKYVHNWGFTLQRYSALAVFAFMLWHVITTRFAGEVAAKDLFGHMQVILAIPVYMIIYMLGLILAAFHLGYGLWLMGITWGITTHPRSQKLSFVAFMGLSALAIAMGLHGLWGFNQRFF